MLNFLSAWRWTVIVHYVWMFTYLTFVTFQPIIYDSELYLESSRSSLIEVIVRNWLIFLLDHTENLQRKFQLNFPMLKSSLVFSRGMLCHLHDLNTPFHRMIMSTYKKSSVSLVWKWRSSQYDYLIKCDQRTVYEEYVFLWNRFINEHSCFPHWAKMKDEHGLSFLPIPTRTMFPHFCVYHHIINKVRHINNQRGSMWLCSQL